MQVEKLNVFDREDFIGPDKYVDLKLSFADDDYNQVQTRGIFENKILDWVVDNVVIPTALSAGGKACADIYKEIFIPEERKKLDEIISKVSEVKEKAGMMIDMYKNGLYEENMNDRINKYVSPLSSHTSIAYRELLKCNPDSTEKINKIVDKWAKGKIEGNSPLTHWKNFVDFLTGSKVVDRNIYQMYDAYVFNTYPFEHCGYAMRENLRNIDLAIIVENACLSVLYYNNHCTGNKAKVRLNDIKDKLEQYKKFAERNMIEYHHDKVICQIKGAHCYFEKSLRMIPYRMSEDWFDKNTIVERFHNSKLMDHVVYGDLGSRTDAERKQWCLTEKEMTAIANYYKNNEDFANLMEVFVKQGGMTDPFDGQKAKYGARLLSSEGYDLDVSSGHLAPGIKNRPLYICKSLNLWKSLKENLIDENVKIGEVKVDFQPGSAMVPIKVKLKGWNVLYNMDANYVETPETTLFFRPSFTVRGDYK